MKARALIVGLLVAAVATPAFADSYYIVRNPQTKKCTIVNKKPTTKTVTVVGNTVYTTRTKAENQMKTIKVCSTGNG